MTGRFLFLVPMIGGLYNDKYNIWMFAIQKISVIGHCVQLKDTVTEVERN